MLPRTALVSSTTTPPRKVVSTSILLRSHNCHHNDTFLWKKKNSPQNLFILRGEQQEQGVGKKQLKKVYAIQLIISKFLAPKQPLSKKKQMGFLLIGGPTEAIKTLHTRSAVLRIRLRSGLKWEMSQCLSCTFPPCLRRRRERKSLRLDAPTRSNISSGHVLWGLHFNQRALGHFFRLFQQIIFHHFYLNSTHMGTS